MDSSLHESTSCFILLDSMRSIVKHSFLAHNSVSYLDLSLCENASNKAKKRKSLCTKRKLDSLKRKRGDFACTHEASRKRLAKNRTLLYNYHLDVSTQLESSRFSFKNRIMEFADNYNGVLLNGVIISFGLYERRLNEMIVAVLLKTQEVKFVRNFLKVKKFIDLPAKSTFLNNRCLEILYSQNADFDIVKEFSETVCLEESDMFVLKPEIFEFFLRHSNCKDFNAFEFHRRQEWVHCCMSSFQFEKVAPLLVHYNAPRFSESAYFKTQTSLRIESGLKFHEMDQPVTLGWTTKERNLLVLQMLEIYYCGIFPVFADSRLLTSGSEALRLVWSSIPDVLINLAELRLFYGTTSIKRDIKKIHRFYSGVFGEEALYPQPRRLQDYCRVAVRKTLTENQRLPDGIGQLGLPPKMESFLKLEKPTSVVWFC